MTTHKIVLVGPHAEDPSVRDEILRIVKEAGHDVEIIDGHHPDAVRVWARPGAGVTPRISDVITLFNVRRMADDWAERRPKDFKPPKTYRSKKSRRNP